ncbi:MAG: SapC family protein [Aurantimonas endophytica]|uniref:SapC family protein n=1 Tax=Aurantimonas endophytica TaxID=1522175 RepID=UPI003002B6C8
MSQTQPVMPLFYERPEALQPERHGALGLRPEPDFSFASRAVSVPISAAEAPFAARHYPIVFATAGEFLPLAVLGLATGENLFVDAAGTWEPGAYIPSYVRRYPFVFATGEDQGRLTLCVDRAAERVLEEGGEKLFENGKPTKVTDNALEFCAAFEREIAATRKIVEILRKHDLLTENQATLTLPSGSKVALKDFMVIDAAAVDKLPDDAFAELRHNGALPLVFAQIASLPGWGDLARRLPAGRAAAEPS